MADTSSMIVEVSTTVIDNVNDVICDVSQELNETDVSLLTNLDVVSGEITVEDVSVGNIIKLESDCIEVEVTTSEMSDLIVPESMNQVEDNIALHEEVLPEPESVITVATTNNFNPSLTSTPMINNDLIKQARSKLTSNLTNKEDVVKEVSENAGIIVPDSINQVEENLSLQEQAKPLPDNVINISAPQNTVTKPLVNTTPIIKGNIIRHARTKLLTSNILSVDEIAKEVFERSEKKRPHQFPEGGDVIFQKQLTKRLAEKIVKEDTLNPNIRIEMFKPPSPPKLPKTENDHPDMDAQMLLQILEEGAESQYPEPVKMPRLPRLRRSDVDKEIEKEMALKQLMEVSQSRKRRMCNFDNSNIINNNNVVQTFDPKPKKRLKNEVQKLLQDEGAINMLYAIEKGEDAKATTLPSKRRMKRALMKKAQEVSQAILDGSTLSKGLRLRHPNETKVKKECEDSPEIKIKKEVEDQPEVKTKKTTQTPGKEDTNQSHFVTPSPTPGPSKIIRRHSSSSSYSGNNSPTRRISLDEGKSDPESKRVVENGVTHTGKEKEVKSSDNTSPKSKSPIKPNNKKMKQTKLKLVNKIVKKSLENAAAKKASVNGTKKKEVKVIKSKTNTPVNVSVNKTTSDESSSTKETSKVESSINEATPIKIKQIKVEVESKPTLDNKSIDLPDQNGFKEKIQNEFTTKLKSMMVRQGLLTKGETPKKVNINQPKSSSLNTTPVIDKQLLNESKTLACKAVWQMLQDDWNMGDDPDDPPSPFDGPSFSDNSPSASLVSEMETSISKPSAMPLINEIAPLPASEPELDVIPENKNEVPFSHQLGTSSFMYKELMLRKIGPLVHVNIAPVSTHLPQAFNVQVLKELTSVLESCGSDQRCKCLLLTSSGSLFSSGVDLPCLLGADPSARSAAAKNTALALKEFALKLGMFSKMVVAGVSGPCVGLGVAMLPFCDLVLSSPRSVYLTPYSSLGYIPEAAATLTLPTIIGHRMASSMLISGRKLSAQEALSCGLVSQVLPEENFAGQVLETAFNLASQSAQSMESTKALLMHSIRLRLNTALTTEASLLQQHWLTHDCQVRIKDKADKLLNE